MKKLILNLLLLLLQSLDEVLIMNENQPAMDQLEDLHDFMNRYEHVYLFGTEDVQQKLAKYLNLSGTAISSFLVRKIFPQDRTLPHPVNQLNTLPKNINQSLVDFNGGVIVASPDWELTDVINDLQSVGFSNFLFLSEWNKGTITCKMTPRSQDRFCIEVNIADHCNLNCQMCDHFSPIAEEKYYGVEKFERDCARLAQLTCGFLDTLVLLGGEPLLCNDLIEYVKIARKNFPDQNIRIFTDGLLLLNWENHQNGNLWHIAKENDIEIFVTRYPNNFDYSKVIKKAEEYQIRFHVTDNIADSNFIGEKFSVKHPLDLTRSVEKFRFINCYQFNKCPVMKDGKIFHCPTVAYIEHFNNRFDKNLIVTSQDFLDMSEVHSYDEIATFLSNRIPFCDYCKTHLRTQHKWRQSTKKIDEWT